MEPQGRGAGPFFDTRWRPRVLLLLLAAAGLLFLSLAHPETRPAWRSADAAVFYALNGSLSDGGGWAVFWAVANYRPVDLLFALLLLAWLVLPGPVFTAPELRRALAGFMVLVFLGIIVRNLFEPLADALGLVGSSPSRVLEPAYRLRELVPWIEAKDMSKRSFPGDHAAVVLLWCGYLLARQRGTGTWLGLLFGCLLMLPRLVGGAHALSDVIVGGGCLALLTLALGFCTPWHAAAGAWLARRTDPLVDRIGQHAAILARFSYFRPSAGSG